MAIGLPNLIRLEENEMIEVKHSPFTTYIKATKDKNFTGRVLFIIEPILQFTNGLPKKLYLDVIYCTE